jgi:PhnB protein
MPPSTPADQLDDAINALLEQAEPGAAGADSEIVALGSIAADLRGMPSQDFRARLASELSRPEPKAPEHQSLTLYLTVRRAPELLEFVKRAFGAVETLRATGSAGGMHAEVRIGTSKLMIGGYAALPFEQPAILHLYVANADAVYRRALEAGATSTHEPVDQPYGDREAGVADPFGNQWYIATHAGASAIPEGLRSVTPYLHPRGAGELIGFLRQVFGAEEVDRFQSPDGVIVHAKIRIGDSIVEMGEAHGTYQPMPPQFYLSVPDVDARYEKALAAGATSIQAPANQPYGVRTAGVTDPFGNVWYIATPIEETAP